MTKTEKFIEKAKKVYGDKYDYSKVEYKNCSSKVEIICPEHGSFFQKPSRHLAGHECIHCANIKSHKRYENQFYIFLDAANLKYNYKFDYSKVIYKNNKTKVEIICPEHGSFFQKPSDHLKTVFGCPKCEKRGPRKNNEDVLNTLKSKFPKFDFKNSEFNGTHKYMYFNCPKHGEVKSTVERLLKPKSPGCPRCGIELRVSKSAKATALTTEQFIEKAKKIHGDKYDYSKVEYKNKKTPVEIYCKICNEYFFQKPKNHLSGSGHKRCSSSTGEKIIREYLIKNNILFEEHKGFDNLFDKKELNYDFYLKRNNTAIEYNGQQHYLPARFGGISTEKAREKLRVQRHHDWLKRHYARKHNINLLIIPYWEENIIKILEDFLNENKN